jgi:hypothetical protein
MTITTPTAVPATLKFVVVKQGDEFFAVVSSLVTPTGDLLPVRSSTHGVRMRPSFPW